MKQFNVFAKQGTAGDIKLGIDNTIFGGFMSRKCVVIVFSISLIALSSSTDARCRIKSLNGSKTGIIITPEKQKQFFALARAWKAQLAVQCCASCMAPVGTKIAVIDSRIFGDSEVIVTDGLFTGCQGDLGNDQIDCDSWR